ncbi:MAG: hypothetical protein KAI07_11050 [Deltaproteobacteria bacterium]|nr:hypothetical protein [Deltaproteobacteria bacterium]
MFTISSDPEFICMDSNGKPKSVIDLLGGSKSEPKKTKNGFVQEDGVVGEINPIPADNIIDFVRNQQLNLQDLKDIIACHNLFVSEKTSDIYTLTDLFHPSATLSGCDPDINAYTGRENPGPDLEDTNKRWTGGHLHIGWGHTDYAEKVALIKALDITLGLPSVSLDTDRERRKAYGYAGSYRPQEVADGKQYNGVEYRVLSSFWIHKPELLSWVFKGVEKAMKLKNKMGMLRGIEDDVQKAINTYDTELAKSLLSSLQLQERLNAT